MDPLLEQLMYAIEACYTGVETGRVVPEVSPQIIRDHLETKYDFASPLPLADITSDVAGMLRDWNLQTTSPNYFGLFNPSVSLASVVADSLASVYNPQLAAWSHAPAANEIERFTLRFLMQQFGLGPETGMASFTSGGAEANLTGILAALTRRFPNYADNGLMGMNTQPVMYLSEEAHDTFYKIAHHTGIGRNALRVIATDTGFRLDVSDLERKFREDTASGRTPFAVVGTAGTTGTGAIDPLDEIAAFAREHDLWFHADAAWGGAAFLSPQLRPHLHGLSLADSITCDAHKWLSVSMGGGMIFCRDGKTIRDTFRARHTKYMPGKTPDADDPYTVSVQWSRRFTGLKLFMSLAERGLGGYVEMLNRQTALGDYLRERLTASGWKIVNDTPLPVVCFVHASGLIPAAVTAELYRRGRTWISEIALPGGAGALRACITSFRTRKENVDSLVNELNDIASTALAGRIKARTP